ncbi:hypothetical protein V2W45_1468173 [Cenococcum geophilum]
MSLILTKKKAINKEQLGFNPIILILDGKRYIKVREEEGKLLYKVTEKEVVNVARYYYHETVYIGGKEDNIYNNGLMMPLRPAGVKIRKGRSSSRKRDYGKPLYEKGNVVNRFNKWNFIDTEELAKIKKGEVDNKGDFLKTVNRLRKVIFLGGRRRKGKDKNLPF